MYRAFFVDDEPLVLEQLVNKKVFKECGFEIAGQSTDPENAVEKIRQISPDVVFTDLRMPGMTGIQMMELLKSGGGNGTAGSVAEFVIVSAYGELTDVRRFFISHGFDYLIKPASDHDLIAVLNRLSDRLSFKPPKSDFISPSKELNEILAYLQDYSAMRHTLESISEKWNINPNTVCNLFAKHLNTTFIAYLTELRMKHAEEMLLATDKSVKEIAYVCGYNDYFYFCRVFRERNNCAPTRFRAINEEKHVKAAGLRGNKL